MEKRNDNSFNKRVEQYLSNDQYTNHQSCCLPADAASDYNVVINGTAPVLLLTSNNAAYGHDAVVINQPRTKPNICSGNSLIFSVQRNRLDLTNGVKGTTNLNNTGNITATTATLNLSNVATATGL
jgi:hypothetical protein